MNIEQFQVHAEVEEAHWWFLGRRSILRDLVSAVAPPNNGHRIIDVGCGTGANIASFTDGYDCVGIDPSPEGIDFARQRFPGVDFVCGHAPADLGDRMGAADVVLLTDVLEHIEDDVGFLADLMGAMAPGARLVMTVPADMKLWSPHDVNYGHFRRYDRESLAAVWASLGVETELLAPFNSWMYPPVLLIRTLTQMRGQSYGDSGTDLHVPAAPLNRLLTRVLASERHVLASALRGTNPPLFPWGVSLAAVLRKP